jgi:hypothetical protein
MRAFAARGRLGPCLRCSRGRSLRGHVRSLCASGWRTASCTPAVPRWLEQADHRRLKACSGVHDQPSVRHRPGVAPHPHRRPRVSGKEFHQVSPHTRIGRLGRTGIAVVLHPLSESSFALSDVHDPLCHNERIHRGRGRSDGGIVDDDCDTCIAPLDPTRELKAELSKADERIGWTFGRIAHDRPLTSRLRGACGHLGKLTHMTCAPGFQAHADDKSHW